MCFVAFTMSTGQLIVAAAVRKFNFEIAPVRIMPPIDVPTAKTFRLLVLQNLSWMYYATVTKSSNEAAVLIVSLRSIRVFPSPSLPKPRYPTKTTANPF